MGTNIFISFRYSDGQALKEDLEKHFDDDREIYNRSENEDRTGQSEEVIQDYLYEKLKNTSITIVILTPKAINYQKNGDGKWDDWLYDELKYSLEERRKNKTNGVIALYTEEAKASIMRETVHNCSTCNQEHTVNNLLEFDNLVSRNTLNIKPEFKKNKCVELYDSNHDSYISLVPYETFKENTQKYIDLALEKRNRLNEFNLTKKM